MLEKKQTFWGICIKSGIDIPLQIPSTILNLQLTKIVNVVPECLCWVSFWDNGTFQYYSCLWDKFLLLWFVQQIMVHQCSLPLVSSLYIQKDMSHLKAGKTPYQHFIIPQTNISCHPQKRLFKMIRNHANFPFLLFLTFAFLPICLQDNIKTVGKRLGTGLLRIHYILIYILNTLNKEANPGIWI